MKHEAMSTNNESGHEIFKRYQQQGFVAPLAVIDESTAAQYAASLMSTVARYDDDSRFRSWTYVKAHLVFPWVFDLAANAKVLSIAESILGEQIVLWDSFIPIKRPHSAGYFGWHQDGTYWSVAPLDQVITVWIAFNSVTIDNGAMQMIPDRSDKQQLPHTKTYDQSSMLRRGQKITSPIDVESACIISLQPGEASVHGAFTVHGSGPNQSNQWRLSVALTYVSGNVGPAPGHVESGIIMRGSQSQLEQEQPAVVELGAAELAEYTRVTTRSAKRYAD